MRKTFCRTVILRKIYGNYKAVQHTVMMPDFADFAGFSLTGKSAKYAHKRWKDSLKTEITHFTLCFMESVE
jgi:hypothetical protein